MSFASDQAAVTIGLSRALDTHSLTQRLRRQLDAAMESGRATLSEANELAEDCIRRRPTLALAAAALAGGIAGLMVRRRQRKLFEA